jgi:signal transduction histidine kinase
MTEKHLAEQREHELALAEERNAFLTDFFSTLSHDLKTPLSIINTSLHLLRRAETIQQQELRMAQISDQVVLMDQYLQDMLTISRLEHLPALEIQQVHLGLLVENVVDSLRPRIEHKQLVCKLSVTPDLPAVRGDLEQLRRMFTNLIENAINYTPFGGQISVTTGSIGGQVTVEIHDTGIGIEAEALPQVFERFFRAPNAKVTGVNGTGLGLAIVKKVVDIHSATIELHSQVGEGTRICIRFPAAPAP